MPNSAPLARVATSSAAEGSPSAFEDRPPPSSVVQSSSAHESPDNASSAARAAPTGMTTRGAEIVLGMEQASTAVGFASGSWETRRGVEQLPPPSTPEEQKRVVIGGDSVASSGQSEDGPGGTLRTGATGAPGATAELFSAEPYTAPAREEVRGPSSSRHSASKRSTPTPNLQCPPSLSTSTLQQSTHRARRSCPLSRRRSARMGTRPHGHCQRRRPMRARTPALKSKHPENHRSRRW